MFLVDDMILRMFGLSLKPFDTIWMLELMRDYALKEKYNIKKINNQIKENELLFELGEVSEDAYKKKREMLLNELEKANEIMEKLSDVRISEGT